MAGQYSHKQFFRRASYDYLALYFDAKGINLDIDWQKLKKNDATVILESIEKLPESQQAEIEAEFQDVNARIGISVRPGTAGRLG